MAQGGRPCGVIEIKLYCDDELVFRSRVDHFHFDQNRHVNTHIDYPERLASKRFIQRSFVTPGNKLPIYDNVRTPLSFLADGTTHSVRYIVTDFAGNNKSIAFNVRGRRNAEAKPRRHLEGQKVEWARTWAADTLGMSVLIPRETFYEDTYVAISSERLPSTDVVRYVVGRRDMPTAKPFSLTVPVPQSLRTLGDKVFIGAGATPKSLSYVGGKQKDGQITAKSSAFGTFMLGVDSVPPRLVMRNKSKMLNAANYVIIGLTDNLSGIARYSVFIDGQWRIFEHDYKNTRLKAQVSDMGLAPGAHHLEAEAEDACGNRSTLSWDFTVK